VNTDFPYGFFSTIPGAIKGAEMAAEMAATNGVNESV
jgi:hypothetical protein